ncbi:MAG: ComEC/Rec2 family competence protein [Patescibacteria group bacterium]|nr:ComEC/Rec2 family competence protein [Patescibacteria group bacterium]
MKKGPAIFWSIFIAAAAFRVWQSLYAEPPQIGDCLKQTVEGSGTISEEPQRTGTGQVLVVDVDGSRCGSGFLIRMKAKAYPVFSYGDHISFKGKLLEPMNFRSDPGREFDYKGYLAKDGIYYEMRSAEASKDDLAARPSVTSILYAIKRRFVENLDRVLGEPHAALAAGLVVGEKAALGKSLLDDFRAVGLIHIVVLSGFNITIVAAAIRKVLSFLPRAWGIAVGGIGIALFGVMVGGGATVIRSCFMAGVALSADLFRRDYDVIRALMFAGLVMVIQSPMVLFHDPGFQLSFLATAGLIMLASPIEERLAFITDRFGLRGIVAATLSTQLFVSPYILYTMGQLSVIGMAANILVLPFIPVTMLTVFATGIAGMASIAASQALGWASHILLAYELFVVQNLARLPFAAVHVPAFSGWWVAGFYSVILTVFFLVRSMNRRKTK